MCWRDPLVAWKRNINIMGKEICSDDVNWIVRDKGMAITVLKMWMS
jgi:hypothetical protein